MKKIFSIVLLVLVGAGAMLACVKKSGQQSADSNQKSVVSSQLFYRTAIYKTGEMTLHRKNGQDDNGCKDQGKNAAAPYSFLLHLALIIMGVKCETDRF